MKSDKNILKNFTAELINQKKKMNLRKNLSTTQNIKSYWIFGFMLFLVLNTFSQNIWINEIKYDNTGADVDDTIEIAGEAGFDLSNFSLLLYNGSNGLIYQTIPLSGFINDEEDGFGAIAFTIPGNIQNGPDGIALIDSLEDYVIQFISYEGSFLANDGIAAGYTSEDIGVSGTSSAIGSSIQLQGTGTMYSDFNWIENVTQTYNSLNTNQSFSDTGSINLWINEIKYDNAGVDVDDTIEVAGEAGIDLSNFSLLLYNGSTGTIYDTIALSGFIDNEDNGFGAIAFTIPGNIQNGPDGIALIDNIEDVVVQFISYEGSFTAIDGSANGYTSENIGVSGASTDTGFSIQLQGTGTVYNDFNWVENVAQTYNDLNTNQNFPTLSVNSSHLEELKIFPNPVKDSYINIKHTNSFNVSATIYDIVGKEISKQTQINNQIDISHLENGFYLFKIQFQNKTIIKKIRVDK